MLFDCDDRDEEERAFEAQAPITRINLFGASPRYTIIRIDQPSPALNNSDLFTEWAKTGKIATVRAGASFQDILEEAETLLEAYMYGKELAGAKGADYRDAVVGAMAECVDNYSLRALPWKTIKKFPVSNMESLITFYLALVSYLVWHRPTLRRFEWIEKAFWEELAKLPKGRTYRGFWEDFMREGRCRFHEHAGGKCWRGGDAPDLSVIARPTM